MALRRADDREMPDEGALPEVSPAVEGEHVHERDHHEEAPNYRVE